MFIYKYDTEMNKQHCPTSIVLLHRTPSKSQYYTYCTQSIYQQPNTLIQKTQLNYCRRALPFQVNKTKPTHIILQIVEITVHQCLITTSPNTKILLYVVESVVGTPASTKKIINKVKNKLH